MAALMPTCNAQGCEKRARQVGLCPMHYARARRQANKAANRNCTLGGCSEPVHAKGLCWPHYARLRRYGDPQRRPINRRAKPPEERFWARVRKGVGCWEIPGPAEDYPQVHLSRDAAGRRRVTQAHRFVWQMLNGEIPAGMYICHHCDNRRCVRPDHLFLGTPKDNVADMEAKGRARRVGAQGENHPGAKLTIAQVEDIRRRYAEGAASYEKLAAEFGVTGAAISLIVRGRNWPSHNQAAQHRKQNAHRTRRAKKASGDLLEDAGS